MKILVSESLNKLPRVDYRTLKEFQGNLKDLTKDNYARLLKSLTEFGWIVPFFIWRHNDKWFVNDGHQRLRVLIKEKIEPHELPYIEIEAKDEQEAKKKLLIISSQYGTIQQMGFDEFVFDLDENWIKETIKFDRLYVDWNAVQINNPVAEWKGMPEYENKDKTAFRDIIVHFKDQKSVDIFFKLIKQPVTEKTRMIWFPEIEIERYIDKKYIDEA